MRPCLVARSADREANYRRAVWPEYKAHRNKIEMPTIRLPGWTMPG